MDKTPKNASRSECSLETKTTHSILPDPKSAKQHVEKTLNVSNTSITRSAGLRKLILVLQDEPEI